LAVDINAGHEKLSPIRKQETFEGLRRTSRLITEQQEKGNQRDQSNPNDGDNE
jgi:hypothetical protein